MHVPTRAISVMALALTVGIAAPAQARHVVWLDFTGFNLSGFATVNGHTPPTASDKTAIQDEIFLNVEYHFALFEIQLVRFQPARGRYTRVRVLGSDLGTSPFTSLGRVTNCQTITCTGQDSWRFPLSGAEIYAGSFGNFPAWSGASATTARIARAIAAQTSHELGHVLGLTDCHAAGDFVESGSTCAGGSFAATKDETVNHHIMASASSGLTAEFMAERFPFFSVRSSRRVLFRLLQARNHYSLLPGLTNSGRSDRIAGTYLPLNKIAFHARRSDGTFLGPREELRGDGGDLGDIFVDVNGRLVRGRPKSQTTVLWNRLSYDENIAQIDQLIADGGDVGDIFRWGDVNGDGVVDLVIGQPIHPLSVAWRVHLGKSAALLDKSTISMSPDAGYEDDFFFLEDCDGDGRDDLVVFKNTGSPVRASVDLSDGESFLPGLTTKIRNGPAPFDYVFVADATGDGRSDLILGEIGLNSVAWKVARSIGGGAFSSSLESWGARGSSGWTFRMGELDGDGRKDLFWARPQVDLLTGTPVILGPGFNWFRARSTGVLFSGIQQDWSMGLVGQGYDFHQ